VSNFPRTVDEITPEWLTQVLRASAVTERANVVAFQPESIGTDAGFARVLNRLHLEFDVLEPAVPTTTSNSKKKSPQ